MCRSPVVWNHCLVKHWFVQMTFLHLLEVDEFRGKVSFSFIIVWILHKFRGENMDLFWALSSWKYSFKGTCHFTNIHFSLNCYRKIHYLYNVPVHTACLHSAMITDLTTFPVFSSWELQWIFFIYLRPSDSLRCPSVGCSRESLCGQFSTHVQLNHETSGLKLRGAISPHCCPLLSEECWWNR